ncbi:MAG: metal ABC transporter substrate-binding protein [Fidelibacterota bacterium]
MKKIIIVFSILWMTLAWGKVRIVTSITDMADIAETIGGNNVSVTSIARGNQNPHYVEVMPSYMLKVRKADFYLKIGMDLDLWSDQIIDGSRNRNIQVVDCSQNVHRLEVPSSKVDASQGDVHRMGNPHYWLDPANGIIIAETIANALISIDPKHREEYEKNLNKFKSTIEEKIRIWNTEFADLKGKKIIFYHNSWPYFSESFGLDVRQFLEPKPGITPSPSHLDRLIRLIEQEHISVIAMEPYFSPKAPEFLKSKTGSHVIVLAQSVDALPEADSYVKLFESNLKKLQAVLGD